MEAESPALFFFSERKHIFHLRDGTKDQDNHDYTKTSNSSERWVLRTERGWQNKGWTSRKYDGKHQKNEEGERRGREQIISASLFSAHRTGGRISYKSNGKVIRDAARIGDLFRSTDRSNARALRSIPLFRIWHSTQDWSDFRADCRERYKRNRSTLY